MASPTKLDTFILRDKFGLSPAELLSAAQGSAQKRAEVMNWEVSRVELSGKEPYSDGEFLCHAFDIWGIEGASMSEREHNRTAQDTQSVEKRAAQDANR